MNFEQKAIIYTSQERSLYLGKLERNFKRANISPTLLISLEDELELLNEAGKPIVKSKSFLLPSGTDISFDTHHSKVAMCFLDDLGKNFDALAPKMNETCTESKKGIIYYGSKMDNMLIEHARYIASSRPAEAEVSALLNLWLNSKELINRRVYDERVAFAVSLIKDSSHLNMSVADIAKRVSLSVPRLIQLFKQVTGTPIRRFRLWHRIFATAEKLSQGHNLTDAALLAGFSDYAHFSRTYRELSGGNPSEARDNTEIRLLAS